MRPDLLGLGQLLEQVGEALVVHRRGELAALRRAAGAHDGGDLGRVHVAQAGGLGGHLADRRRTARAPRRRRRGGSSGGGAAGCGAARRTLAISQPRLRGVVDGAQRDVADRLVADALVDDVARRSAPRRAAA